MMLLVETRGVLVWLCTSGPILELHISGAHGLQGIQSRGLCENCAFRCVHVCDSFVSVVVSSFPPSGVRKYGGSIFSRKDLVFVPTVNMGKKAATAGNKFRTSLALPVS